MIVTGEQLRVVALFLKKAHFHFSIIAILQQGQKRKPEPYFAYNPYVFHVQKIQEVETRDVMKICI